MAFTTPVEDKLPLKTASVAVEGAAEVISFTGEVMKRERMDPALEAVYPTRPARYLYISMWDVRTEAEMSEAGDWRPERPSGH